MQVKNISRVSLTAWRSTQQETNLAVRPGLFGQVIVNNQGIFAAVAEILTHGAPGVRSDVLHGCRLGCRCRNYDGVRHRVVLF